MSFYKVKLDDVESIEEANDATDAIRQARLRLNRDIGFKSQSAELCDPPDESEEPTDDNAPVSRPATAESIDGEQGDGVERIQE